ncbi:MAG: nuclear transport factor 2 family protein [Breznakibacter sp.]
MKKEPHLSPNQLIEEAKALLTQLVKSQEEGDLSLFESCFLHTEELVNIGTDLDEIWYGWDDFSRFMKNAITERKGHKIQELNTRIVVDEGGTTAWYSQLIDTCIETKSEPFRLEGFRHTGVMIFRNGQWRIAQSHISAPIIVNLEQDGMDALE